MVACTTFLLAVVAIIVNDATSERIFRRFRDGQISSAPQIPGYHLSDYSDNTLGEYGHNSNMNMHKMTHSTYPKYSSYSTSNISRTNNVYTSRMAPQQTKGRPTVVPAQYFDPKQDADTLRQALKNRRYGDIINILTHRSLKQRLSIMVYYPDMKKDLERNLHSSFRDIMVALLTQPENIIVQNLEEALKFSTSIDEALLVELLGALNNTQLLLVKNAYRKQYGRELQNDITSFSLNKFAVFFSSFIAGHRDERPWVDHDLATKDAETLKNMGRLNIDGSSFFTYLMTSRSFDQLNRTFVEYRRLKGYTLESTIKKDFSGNVRTGLLNIVKSISKRWNYFAEILHNGLESLRNRDAVLIRIPVLHSETDMGSIVDAYSREYRTTLYNDISRKTHGDFKDAVLALVM